jgi:hypothetical protein
MILPQRGRWPIGRRGLKAETVGLNPLSRFATAPPEGEHQVGLNPLTASRSSP